MHAPNPKTVSEHWHFESLTHPGVQFLSAHTHTHTHTHNGAVTEGGRSDRRESGGKMKDKSERWREEKG